jgi:protein-S-isoprenylcysteine O-methyltransferase Ste14
MNHGDVAYGLWTLVIVNSAVFILFAFSFFKPRSKRDWRTFGTFSAFVMALFAEMYGFPLSVYLLSGWLARRFPGIDPFGHDAGHLWYTVLGFKGDPHLNPIHLLSNLLIIGGFVLLASAWRVLYAAQREGKVATTGAYSYVRHPQYMGFIVIMTGFLLQWPTLPTLLMYPILVTVYVRLARREEREVKEALGADWERYAEVTPAFVPRPRRPILDGQPRTG